MIEGKIKELSAILDSVFNGNIFQNRQNKFVYTDNKYKEKELDVRNMSLGQKTLGTIKTLLQNGTLEDNGTIVLDEPEVNLHPEWQLKFAELIVLLQREFGMHILLTTHSPYFLNAIEVYSEKYGIDEKCKYYVAENEENGSVIKDVTDNTREIYEKLARPIQDLENLRYSSGVYEGNWFKKI